jgi:membrane protease YdiL (CAAX protease family)
MPLHNSTIYYKTILSIEIIVKVFLFFLCTQIISSSLLALLSPLLTGHALRLSDLHDPNNQLSLALSQGLGMLLGFIGLPYFYWTFVKKESWSKKIEPLSHWPNTLLLTLGLFVLCAPLIEELSLLNKQIQLPVYFSELETWLKKTEHEAELMTQLFIQFSTWPMFMLIFFVICIVPAVGEELLFRSLLQKELQKIINPHVAIWLSGFLFSFLHFQFYGFLPRMFLGVLFGYCYWWSGSILVTMFFHFVNNFSSLIVNTFFKDLIDVDKQAIPRFDLLPFMLYIVMFLIVVYFYYKQVNKNTLNHNNT